jgi:hypothetical protein
MKTNLAMLVGSILATMLHVSAVQAVQPRLSTLDNAGGFCTPANQFEAEDFRIRPAFLENTGASSRFVTCPLAIKDFADFTGMEVHLRVRSGGGRSLTCALYSYDENGRAFFTHALPTTTKSDAPTTLSLYVHVPAYLREPARFGYASVLCLLPPHGRIYGNRTRAPTLF